MRKQRRPNKTNDANTTGQTDALHMNELTQLWFFNDAQGRWHGPHDTAQMLLWCRAGYFAPSCVFRAAHGTELRAAADIALFAACFRSDKDNDNSPPETAGDDAAADDDSAATAATAAAQVRWCYKDPNGQEQGPFSAAQLGTWIVGGFFSRTTLVRREDEDGFRTLGNVFEFSAYFDRTTASQASGSAGYVVAAQFDTKGHFTGVLNAHAAQGLVAADGEYNQLVKTFDVDGYQEEMRKKKGASRRSESVVARQSNSVRESETSKERTTKIKHESKFLKFSICSSTMRGRGRGGKRSSGGGRGGGSSSSSSSSSSSTSVVPSLPGVALPARDAKQDAAAEAKEQRERSNNSNKKKKASDIDDIFLDESMQELIVQLLNSLRDGTNAPPATTAAEVADVTDASTSSSAASTTLISSPLMTQLLAHGFSADTARTALDVTGSSDINELLDFIFANNTTTFRDNGDDEDVSIAAVVTEPEPAPAAPAAPVVDDALINRFTRYGFSSDQVSAIVGTTSPDDMTVVRALFGVEPLAVPAEFDRDRCESDRGDELLALQSIFDADLLVDAADAPFVVVVRDELRVVGELSVWLPESYPDAESALVAWRQPVDIDRSLPMAQVRELNDALHAKSIELSGAHMPYLFELVSWLKDEIVALRAAMPAPAPEPKAAKAAKVRAAPKPAAAQAAAPRVQKADPALLAKAAAVERTRVRLEAQRAAAELEAQKQEERDAYLLRKMQHDAELEKLGLDPVEEQRRRDRELAEQLAALAAPPPPTANEREFSAALRQFSLGEMSPDVKIDADNGAASLISNARYRRFLKMKAALFRHVDVSGIDVPTAAAPEGSRVANFVAARQYRAEAPLAAPPPALDDAPAAQQFVLQPMLTHKPVFGEVPPPSAEQQRRIERDSQRLLRDLRARERGQFATKQGELAATQRRSLPAYAMRDAIVGACRESRVVVIAAETGAGKTTQVGQLILDDYVAQGRGGECSIICTQPRRLAAISVAERVAVERDEQCGATVGYSIRLESKMSKATRLLFCTTGVLLRRLQSDEALGGVSHVILDEVHERTIESDLLMAILRDLLRRRADLRLVLMSATVNAKTFADYFAPVCAAPVIVDVPGRTFEVSVLHLEDVVDRVGYIIEEDSEFAVRAPRDGSGGGGNKRRQTLEAVRSVTSEAERLRELREQFRDVSEQSIRTLSLMDPDKINYELLEETVWRVVAGVFDDCLPPAADGEHAELGGAVLVFLPGMAEIQELYDLLSNDGDGRAAQIGVSVRVLVLHSELGSDEQRLVFERPPRGVVKVCLATNIAETSLTIDDISYVIDCGMHKELRFDTATEIETLDTTLISQANAKQRRGRAGRVRGGLCLRMFTSEQHRRLARYPLPEVHRCDLEQLFLQVLLLELGGVREFVATLIEPPHANMVSVTTRRLQQLGAIDDELQLTPLGFHVATLPLEARLAKALLMASVLACVEPVAVIAACLTHRSPFVAPFDRRDAADAARRAFSGTLGRERSDHLTLLAAYRAWRREAATASRSREHRWCHQHFLSLNTLRMIEATKNQFLRLLASIQFCRLNRDGTVAHEFNANADEPRVVLGALTAGLYPNVARIDGDTLLTNTGAAVLHPTSVVSGGHVKFASRWLVFFAKLKTRQVYIRDASMVDPLVVVLFGGHVHVQPDQTHITVDQWIKLRAPAGVATVVRELRLAIERVLLDKIRDPKATQTTQLTSVMRTLLMAGAKPPTTTTEQADDQR
jgi:ATP-dependent RNA helicase DHX36